MMPDLSSAPQPLQRLAEWLADSRAPLRVQSFDSPSNQLLQAQTPRGTVQVLADRGQWFVELAPPDASEYFDTAVWNSCLSGTEVSLELVPLDAQAAWLEEYLAGDEEGEYTIECLREARRRRAYGRMGLKR
jgi:hypothetical protein